MEVVIAGGGIAGLTTALRLHQYGIGCVVFEQAEAIRELGVGINLLPNAVQQLAELGLLPELEASAVCTHELILANRHGQPIWREPRGRAAGHDVPQLSIHRGVLQRVLYEAAVDRLGAGSIVTDRRLVDARQCTTGVHATFANRRDGSHEVAEGDVLIGADGIHSAVRAILNPDEGPPRWNGVMMWRGATDWPAFLDGQSMIVAGGTTGKLVVYPIGPGTSAERRLTNWAVVSKVGETEISHRAARTGRGPANSKTSNHAWPTSRSTRSTYPA
jgi:2-polyprenyl-6-methoxyphenol hydroxylase-like FAD-dependent oxidoreductase